MNVDTGEQLYAVPQDGEYEFEVYHRENRFGPGEKISEEEIPEILNGERR